LLPVDGKSPSKVSVNFIGPTVWLYAEASQEKGEAGDEAALDAVPDVFLSFPPMWSKHDTLHFKKSWDRILRSNQRTERMITEIAEAAGAFVDALTDFLLATRRGTPSLQLRWRLATARAQAQLRLTPEEYRDAVLMAERAAG
jgi:hypothetical protein